MAVIDSSVLIHLSRINKLYLLKKYFRKIKITGEVFEETVSVNKSFEGKNDIKEACTDWIKVINLKNKKKIKEISEINGIEEADSSLILLAEKEKEIILTNDYLLVQVSKSRKIACWWLTTFLLKLLKKKIIKKNEAKKILFELIQNGLRISIEVYAAIEIKINEFT